jgi:hypothetical protein
MPAATPNLNFVIRYTPRPGVTPATPRSAT